MKAKFDKPSMSVVEVVNATIKDGNLKPLCELYETFDESGQRVLEEATIKHMNIFNKVMVEIMSGLPKNLNDILQSRRLIAKKKKRI